MALKNQPLVVTFWTLNTLTNEGMSGYAPYIQLKEIGDGVEYSLSVSAVEVNANTLPGLYSVSLPASATNYNFITIGGITSSSDIVVVPVSFATERGYLETISGEVNGLVSGVNVSGITTGVQQKIADSMTYALTSAISTGSVVDYIRNVSASLATTAQLASVSASLVTEIDANETKLNNVQITINQISGDTNSILSNGVNVSAITDGIIVSADFATSYYNKIGEIVTDNSIQGTVSANITQVNGVAITIDDLKNTDQEMYDMAVSAIEDKFTFSGAAVYSYGLSASINAQEVVDAMLSTTVDTKTFTEVLEILIAMATGKISRANNKFTYYKQDNSTELYTLESVRNERTRL